MKWPWTALLRDNERLALENANLRADIAILARYDNLLEKYHALRATGASIPEAAQTLERPVFDPVMVAITAKAGPDRKLRAMMSREAMQSRAAGIPDIEIIQAIEQGVTVDEEGVA